MDKVASVTGIPPPYRNLPPHITVLRPIPNIDESILKNLVKSVALRMKQTKITLNGLCHFEKQHVVLPVQATRSTASLWVDIDNFLSRLPGYEHGEDDARNSLHVTVATRMSHVFDTAWPEIRKIEITPMTFSPEEVALYRKPVIGGVWTQVCTFNIAK